MKAWIFFLTFVFTLQVFGQQDEKISWDKEKPISWSDFKSTPKKHLPYKANTNSGVSFSWNSTRTSDNETILNYEVISYFYPSRSWVKEIEEVGYLLAHEQLHFDITELHARKLRKALDSYQASGSIKKDLNTIYSDIEKQRREMQQLFDKETNHSINKEAEARWQEYIKAEILKLENFK